MTQRTRAIPGRFPGCFTIAVLVFVPLASGEFETPIAITDVTIVIEPGNTVENGTILIANGHIVTAGENVAIPSHAELIDGKGLIAYPGLIDGQTFLGIPKEQRESAVRERAEDVNPDRSQRPLPATRFANRRGIRPHFRAASLFTADQDAIKAHRSGGFAAALIAPRDGILSGTSAFVNLSGVPIRRCVLDADVAMHGSFRTGEEGDYPGTLLGIFAQFRQVMLDAGRHTKVQEFAKRHPASADRPPVDETLDAIQPLLRRSQRLFFEANTENEIRRALDLAGEFNLDVGITGAKEAWKVIDRIKAENIPLIVSLKFDDEPEYGKKKKADSKKKPESSEEDKDADPKEKSPEEESKSEKKAGKKKDEKKIYEPLRARKERRRLWEEQVANTIRLHEAGVPFALRTRDLKGTSKFWTNLRTVIDRGLPEDAALTALTSVPARMFGLGDRLGAIRPNRIANLTLMSKPLSDEKAKVKFVFVDGRKFEIDAEDKKDGKGARGRKHGGEPGDTDEPTEESTEDDSSETEPTEEEEKDTGPSFEVEIKADRIPATKTGGNVLITGATIIPVSAPTLQNASILILDGKIAKIGEVLNVPDGVTVIDGTGRFVIPGFVDSHSHLGIDGVNESALAISAEVRIADLINPQHVGIFRAVAGGTTTHHVMHGSANPIGGQNAIVKTKYGRSAAEMLIADAPRLIKFALGENVIQSNRQRAWGKRFPNTRMGVEAVIRAACEAGKAYRAEWDEYAARVRRGEDVLPPRRDLRLEALADVLAGDLTVHSHCYRSDEILRLFNVAEDYGFRIGTLHHVLEGYRIAPEIARHGAGASTFSNFWAYKLEAYGAIAHNAALMTDHGINVSIKSDSANTIRYLGLEAAKSIKWGGLNENQVLRLVTINPAMQLQIADRVGSLEVGKDGDLAIFNGHPLNTFAKCIMTIIEGEVYFEDDRPDPVEPADAVTGKASLLVLPGAVDRTIPETPHRVYAIVDATIHPISGPVIDKGTVVIVEDRIYEVGTDVTVPAGAGVINGQGLHVYPGLIDAGGNLGTTEIRSLRATRDSADIATFAPHLRARSAVHPHSVHIRIARTAGITTALTKPAGGRISGQSAIIHLDGWTADEMIIVDEYALHMTVPSLPDRPRRFRGRTPDPKREEKAKKEHKKAVKKLDEFMAKAKHYAKVKELAADDPEIEVEVDLVLEAMIPYVLGKKPVVFSANGYKHMLETIEFIEKHKLDGILDGATQAWKLADVLAEKNIPVIFSSPLSYPRGEFEPWDSIYRCAGDLQRAGVKFCFASGSASGAYNLGMQAGMAVAHGLSQKDAEYALTLGAAEILGIADRVGSIEPGKLADLIVTTDTPLQAASQVTHMFIAGKPIELTSLHTESYEKFKNRPAPDLPPPPELVGPPDLTTR